MNSYVLVDVTVFQNIVTKRSTIEVVLVHAGIWKESCYIYGEKLKDISNLHDMLKNIKFC